MKIVSWQYLLTDHQVYTWRELQKRGHEVQFVLGKSQDEDRAKQGWNNTLLEGLKTYPLPTKRWWRKSIEIIQQNKDAIHIFSGFWANKRFLPLILFALRTGVHTTVMNESYSEVKAGYLKNENKFIAGVKVYLRPILYKMTFLLCKIFSNKNELRMLSIGSPSKKQFQKAGFEEQYIYPWGYFVPQLKSRQKQKQNGKPVKLIFIGNLLPIKGLDLAIRAIEIINQDKTDPDVILDIYGYGDPEKWISANSKAIFYKGFIPFGNAQEVLSDYDYLILPSRHDGWGVVVNEALLRGVPVIASDNVGARVLLENSEAGMIFKSEDVNNLIVLLTRLVEEPDQRDHYAKNANLIADKISPAASAIYLEQILEFAFYQIGNRPVPNWEK